VRGAGRRGWRRQGGSAEARQGTKIVVGPWTHGGSFGLPGFLDLKLRWYDYWLKGMPNGVDREPPIRIYVMGAEQTVYHDRRRPSCLILPVIP
jgi:predicted acyl esterase